MYLNLLRIINSDKTIEHELLGQLSCSSLQESYLQCMTFINNDSSQQRHCRPYYEFSTQSDHEASPATRPKTARISLARSTR